MKHWAIHTMKTGLFPGTPDPERLHRVLCEGTGREWTLARSVSEGKRQWFFFTFAELLLIVLHAQEQVSAFLVADGSDAEERPDA